MLSIMFLYEVVHDKFRVCILLKQLLQEKHYVFIFVYPWPGNRCYEKNRI